LERSFRGHKDAVQSVVFNTNMKQLISGSLDGNVMIWNFKPQLRAYKLVGHKVPFTHASKSWVRWNVTLARTRPGGGVFGGVLPDAIIDSLWIQGQNHQALAADSVCVPSAGAAVWVG
jgi:WD40 repeat protein